MNFWGKLMNKIFLLLSFIAVFLNARAGLNVDFKLEYKKSFINKNTILKSEFQEVLDFTEKSEVELFHNNLRVVVKPNLDPKIPEQLEDKFGPHDVVFFNINVFKKENDEELTLSKAELLVRFDDPASFQVKAEGFGELNLNLKPYL